MNILVIGNGFDIEHGLPTKYTDFLKYCANYNINRPVSSSPDMNEEFVSFCDYNFWLRYFYSQIPDIDDIDENTWIDFEKEIAETIQKIQESAITINSEKEIVDIDKYCEGSALIKKIFDECEFFDDNEDTFDNFVYSQLRKFVRAFEIYCLHVNEISLSKPIINMQRKIAMEETRLKRDEYAEQARNIEESIGKKEAKKVWQLNKDESDNYSLLSSKITHIDFLSLSLFNCVLSFNYTNTYERLYGSDKTKYCYIHGKAQSDRKKTNIILGIDDELSPDEQSKNFRWIRFKKYYQRIIFKTGSEYKDWFSFKKESTNYVHIVGHSLEKTDYDVLYEILNDNSSKIIVYYYSPADFENKVQKVIRLLSYKGLNGRDELIRRVHGSNWSIKFVDQYDEKEGLFLRTSK